MVTCPNLGSHYDRGIEGEQVNPAALTDVAASFPLRVGQGHLSLDQYESESANSEYSPFAEDVLSNPNGLYLDCSLRSRMHGNCLHVKVYASVSADVIMPSDCSYPFNDGSFDRVGYFAGLWKLFVGGEERLA